MLADASASLGRSGPPASGSLLARLLAIPAQEVCFDRRGFQAARQEAQRRLERIGEVFILGHRAALNSRDAAALEQGLADVDVELRGFAYEGAAMALAMAGLLLPWRWPRLLEFLRGHASAHVYMAHVGIGWAVAALRWPLARVLSRLDPLLCWLAVDGLGFYHGYFHWPRAVRAQAVPRRLRGYARRAFDQGLGRSLWFVEGADAARVAETVEGFVEHRRADLWSGVGLACAYAGGVDDDTVADLARRAGSQRPWMAQGACFAATARERAGNRAAHTARAVRILCGVTEQTAARITDEALVSVDADEEAPRYERWRQRIHASFRIQTMG